MTSQPTAAAAGTIDIGGDLTVNRMGYGAMRITGRGIWGEPPDREVAKAAVRRAVELEVNFIDTADSYGPEVSETLIAEALYPYPDGLVIATKGGLVRPAPGRWDADGGVFPDVDLDSDDPEAKVSRRHARISLRNGQYVIEDLGSTNGTFVNRGHRLAPGDRQPLKDGDEIIVGKTFLRFRVAR